MKSDSTAIDPDHFAVCVMGDADPSWWTALRADVGESAPLLRHDDPRDRAGALHAAVSAHPHHWLILLQAGTLLPPFWRQRLHRTLAQPQAWVVAALDVRELAAIEAPADASGLGRLDRLCFLYGSRAAMDSEHLDAPLLAVHPSAFEWLAAADWGAPAAPPEGGRVLELAHLLVAGPRPANRSIRSERKRHRTLARAVLAAGDWTPQGYPGLDARPVLLHVLHGWGGGAARWVQDWSGADERHHHLILGAEGSSKRHRYGERFTLRAAGLDGPSLRSFEPSAPIADVALTHTGYRQFLDEILRGYGVDAVVVSSLIGHSLDVLRCGLPLLLAVHDHFPLWPMLHRDFGHPSLRFDAAQLRTDLQNAGNDFEFAHRDPDYWQRLHEAYVGALSRAHARLIAPSRSALENHLKLAPALRELDQHVIPHGMDPWPRTTPGWAPPQRKRLRLLVPGRIRRGKGGDLLRAVLPKLREQAEIVLLGAGAEGMAYFGEADVHVVLDYRREQLPGLLARFAPDAALLLPSVAETFSYTLSEMRSLGVPVLATRLGALAERIEDGVDGFLAEPTPAAVLARVMELAADRDSLEQVRARLREDQTAPGRTTNLATTTQAYADILNLETATPVRYQPDIAGMHVQQAHALQLQALQSREQASEQHERLRAEQQQLEQRTQWAVDLERRLRQASNALENTHAELQARSRWALQLDEELQRIKPEYERTTAQLERTLSSASWRITAPLRATKQRLRALHTMIGYRLGRMRSLRGRLRGSLARRGFAGTLARLRAEFAGTRSSMPRVIAEVPRDDGRTIELPDPGSPRVSVVIPVHDKLDYTVACLRSLAEHAGKTAFEVVVVDDASSDATPRRLAQVEHLRMIRNSENLGFVGSCNAGATEAHGEILLFLNNDTSVTPGWLEAMVDCLENAPQAGLVGARLLYPDGRLQEAGGIVFNDASGWNYGRFDDAEDPRYGFRREVDYCSGAAIAMQRALFEQLGGFDTRYAPAYYEDTDLGFAVRAAGLRVYYEPRATIIHHEGVTAGTDTGSGMKRYQVVNRDKFRDKWRDALSQQPAPIHEPARAHLAATHRARRRVLIVDATLPTPDQDSGSLRMANLMRVLRGTGAQVTFMPDNLARIEPYAAQLQAEGVEVLYHPQVASALAFYRQRGSEFDSIILSRHYVAAHHVGPARLYAPQAKLLFDTVDLHYLREQRAADLSGGRELLRQASVTRAQEQKIMRECDVTLVVSASEKIFLAQQVPQARVEVLSNVHEVHGRRRDFSARSGLVFVGGFQHPPNQDAVEWFVREVFQRIRRAQADTTLHVIGSKVPPAISELAGDGVIVHGYVEDIAPYMDGCRLSVAPLRYGAGVKGKVNMAMSYGLPVIATTIAVEGMHVRDGEDVLVADSAEQFATAVLRAYHDEALWTRLSDGGLANVHRHFSFDAASTALERVLN